jgi:hypothetical protein
VLLDRAFNLWFHLLRPSFHSFLSFCAPLCTQIGVQTR